ncbi:MAG: peptidoglycan-associated lipoprotein Pal [Desulfobacterales bacterium]|nr:MAG: peptidoglycan-associated lipoprotein Pal [Desulfobacterales bacterium]
MQKTNRLIPVILLVILAFLITVSCSKKTVTTTKDPLRDSAQTATTLEQRSSSIQQQDLAQSQMASETDSGQRVMTVLLEDIYFEFDKSTLTSQAKQSLVEKAKWLSANLDVRVIIEGHCDERGTNEYNLALGDRRAASTKTFLVDLGISPSRLTIISYGEERPLVPGHSEDAWAKNRRAHFGIE